MRLVEAELEAMFPTPKPDRASDTLAAWNPAELPEIPGYQVEAVLGRGGMGIVYKARHLRLNRSVALKMLLTGAYAGPQERERFLREAEAVAGLRHPNLVQVYDVGDHDGLPYFTMEYVEGGSLAQKLLGTPQCVHYAAACVATLAEAVQVAHQGGIVHRDLKPANILLSPNPNIESGNSKQNPKTTDFTPKIVDFGLARHFGGDSALTLSGVRVGTPSYMAPEQAMGKTRSIGPAVDIYSLGAVLYELLTGRPPFKGETATETQLQVIHQDPVPPSRLNPRVPRDLETICLKCLEKDPARRYATAAALADDLRRLEEGRPIKARPLGWGARSWRWCRRKPAVAALVATALALVGLASGGGVWLVQQRARHDAEMRNDVGTAVAQAESLRKGFHFREARELLEQARLRLGPAGPEDLRRQVDQGRGDLDLVERLDSARIRSETLREEKSEPAKYDPLYASAFAEALGQEGDDVETVAASVRNSAVRAEIVAALDDWASLTPDPSRQAWLLAVARGADPDPARDRLRQPGLWQDRIKLTRLVQELSAADVSPQLATALGRVARAGGGDAVPLLTASQARFPQDFWLNLELGWELFEAKRLDEAIGYDRAALALRPQVSVPHNNLGCALYATGRLDEAIDHLQQALRIDSNFASTHNNLALALYGKGRRDEAIDQYRQALRIEPKSAAVHINLGLALYDKGRLDEAIDHFQHALRTEPHSATAHHALGRALRDQKRLDEAIDQYRQALRIEPESASLHIYLGQAFYDKDRLEEAIDHFQQALHIEPESALAQAWLRISLYSAARSAVRAAADEGSEAGRADKRRQALAWLRANLELTTKLHNDGKVVGSSLSELQRDPDLAGVRDPVELAKLPAAEREQWQVLWADVAALVAADPLEQGRAHAARRDWAHAADGYARAVKGGPTDDGHFWFEYAALSLLAGDRPGYARACAHMVERCGKDKGLRSYHVARACTLAPHAVADMSLPGRLAERELQGSREFWSLTEQGALAYRAGRFQEAVPLFEQSLKADARPGRAVLNWLWLALANQRLGKAEEARRWRGKAQAWLDQYGDGMPARAQAEVGLHLHNWLEAHVLRREAEALIQPAEKR
jgi:tetratricopeptide (TPR) repeat protein/tRNA A-37 threonylcarbamoyl transferase component Bud32